MPLRSSTLRLTDGALGLALLGTAIGSIAAIPVTGALVDRYDEERLAELVRNEGVAG